MTRWGVEGRYPHLRPRTIPRILPRIEIYGEPVIGLCRGSVGWHA